jgi:hypothetical protein
MGGTPGSGFQSLPEKSGPPSADQFRSASHGIGDQWSYSIAQRPRSRSALWGLLLGVQLRISRMLVTPIPWGRFMPRQACGGRRAGAGKPHGRRGAIRRCPRTIRHRYIAGSILVPGGTPPRGRRPGQERPRQGRWVDAGTSCYLSCSSLWFKQPRRPKNFPWGLPDHSGARPSGFPHQR